MKRADLYYQDESYYKALRLYEDVFKKDRNNNEALRRMADAAYKAGENDLALRYYKRLIQRDKAEPADLLGYAKALRKDANYEEAAYWLMEYRDLQNDSLGQNFEDQLAHIEQLLQDSVNYTIRPSNVNTHLSELGPVVYGDKLIFCSAGRRSGTKRKSYGEEEPYLKIFASQILPDGQLGTPEVYAPNLRTKAHDGPLAIASEAGKMFVTQNQKFRGVHLDPNKIVQLKIQQASLQDGDWKPSAEFPFNSKKYSVAHPAVNADGRILVFASNQDGGYGLTDLYISYFDRGNWTTPRNLGPLVNTSESELFPYLANDSTLYFSSSGLEGLGGLDLFRADLKDGKVVRVKNLGAPINSSYDDFSMAFTVYDEEGYFASNRGGKRNDDLYYFERNIVPLPVRVIVQDSDSKEKVKLAQVIAVDVNGDTIATSLTGVDGSATLTLNRGEAYSLRVSRRSYFESRMDLVCEKADQVEIDMQADLQAEGDGVRPLYMDMEDGEPIQVLEVYAVHYDLAKWTIRDDAYDILNPIIDVLAENPDLEVRIESHADSRGRRESNNILSDKRAKVIDNYFISRYIRPERIRYKGFGESRLLNICYDGVKCSEEEHAVNRRSIIKVIRKGPYHEMRLKRAAFYF
ncbi:OmpA family protein [Mangrovibacterium diazotrophicum]|nr:OmpA family protein [Mangrovibacterium diazotrophicum]